MSQEIKPQLVDALATNFPRSDAIATAWGNTVSDHLLIPHLRAYWPFTSVDENGDVYDLSGQGRVLSNNGIVTFLRNSLLTYADFVPASTQYLYRADEAGLDILADLTIGSWFKLDTLAPGTNMGLISKYDTAGGNNRAYILYFDDATNTFRFIISSLGTAASQVILTSTAIPAIDTWYHIVATYVPGTSMTIYVNGVATTLLVGVPAAIFNSPAQFRIGDYNTGQLLDGKAAHCFIAATALEEYFVKALFWHSCPMFGVKP